MIDRSSKDLHPQFGVLRDPQQPCGKSNSRLWALGGRDTTSCGLIGEGKAVPPARRCRSRQQPARLEYGAVRGADANLVGRDLQ